MRRSCEARSQAATTSSGGCAAPRSSQRSALSCTYSSWWGARAASLGAAETSRSVHGPRQSNPAPSSSIPIQGRPSPRVRRLGATDGSGASTAWQPTFILWTKSPRGGVDIPAECRRNGTYSPTRGSKAPRQGDRDRFDHRRCRPLFAADPGRLHAHWACRPPVRRRVHRCRCAHARPSEPACPLTAPRTYTGGMSIRIRVSASRGITPGR